MVPRWKLDRHVEQIQKDSPTTFPVNCHDTTCPEFGTCHQVPSQGRMFGQDKARVFYLMSSPGVEDAEMSLPCLDQAGIYMREQFVLPVTRSCPRTPYIITHLIRSNIGDAEPSVKVLRQCWLHLSRELERHTPELLVVFGVGTFSGLWSHIVNRSAFPPRDEQTQGALVGQFFPVEFSNGIKTTLYVAYHPQVAIVSPVMDRFIAEDRHRVVAYLNPSVKLVQKKSLAINRITLLKSSAEVLDYLDYLADGFPNPVYAAFDTETFNLNRCHNNAFLTWQFSIEEGEAVVLPIEHPDLPLFRDPILKRKLAAAAQRLFDRSREETNIKWWMMHGGKFDLAVLYGLLGVLPRSRNHVPIWDTMLAAHWLDENRKAVKTMRFPFALKTLGLEFFGFQYKQEALERRAEGELQDLPLEDLVDYGGSDTILTRGLGLFQHELAELQPNRAVVALSRMMQHYFSNATKALAIMECNGMYTNREHIEYLQGEDSPIWTRLEDIDRQLQELPEVKLFRRLYRNKIGVKDRKTEYEDSPWDIGDTDDYPLLDLNKQLTQKLFYLDFLQMDPLSYSSETNEPSLDKKFLMHYADPLRYREAFVVKDNFWDRYGSPIVDEKGEKSFNVNPVKLDLEYRELKTLGTKYSSAMHAMLLDPKGDCTDSRIRASYNIHGTDTGRLSSSEPNFQNIPAGRTKHAKGIKNMFQAERGTVLIQADAKAAEVRWAANYCQDPQLVKVFREAHDVLRRACESEDVTDEEFQLAQLAADLHRRTASLMFGIPPAEVSGPMRQSSKSITFGLMFGMNVKTLAANNGWSVEEAEEKLEAYFSAFPKLRRWLDEIKRVAHQQGYVETFMGRRRRLQHLFNTGVWMHQGDAERRAMNSPIQGQSSDAGVIALFLLNDYILEHNLEKRWLLQNVVHDSVLMQVPREDVEKAVAVMRDRFEDGMQEYIEKWWNVKLMVPIEWEFEIGIRYGDLHKWDGRPKTFVKLLDQLDGDAKTLWKVKEETSKKPSSQLDLIRWEGK